MPLAALEEKLKALWGDLSGEAKAEIRKALADAQAEMADVKESNPHLLLRRNGLRLRLQLALLRNQ